jgi:hypothetical protein
VAAVCLAAVVLRPTPDLVVCADAAYAPEERVAAVREAGAFGFEVADPVVCAAPEWIAVVLALCAAA